MSLIILVFGMVTNDKVVFCINLFLMDLCPLLALI